MNREPTESKETLMAEVVQLIISGKTEVALTKLSKFFEIAEPLIRVGKVKGNRRALACYKNNEATIIAANRQILFQPAVVLHEFYHHLRSHSGKHRGNEKLADRFALTFIDAYQKLAQTKARYNGGT